MSDSQDYILDCEYDPHGDRLLDVSADREEEPMDEDDCIILEEEEDLLSVPAELEVDLGLFTCGDRDIFEDDPPVNSSLYSLY